MSLNTLDKQDLLQILQEQFKRINQLESELLALKKRVTALEP